MRSRSRVTGCTTTTTIALAPASNDDDDHHHDHDHHHNRNHNHRGRDGSRYRIIIQRPAADAPPPTGRRPDDCDIDGHGRGGDESLNDDHDGRRRSSRTRGYAGLTKTFDGTCEIQEENCNIMQWIRINKIPCPRRGDTIKSTRFIFRHYG
ncbi:hypothetical protein QTP88_003840 [Uroleucon formosanum]